MAPPLSALLPLSVLFTIKTSVLRAIAPPLVAELPISALLTIVKEPPGNGAAPDGSVIAANRAVANRQ